MMSRIQAFFRWWRGEVEEEPNVELTVHNCGLSKEQLRLGRFTVKALGPERHSDALSMEDLVFLCYSVGMNPPEYVIEAKLRALGLSKHERHTFEHFLHLWRALLENQDEEEVILERAFNFFDKDGNGEISTSEFKATMTELGNLLGEEEIDEFLALMDTNHDGAIDYGEFIRLLKCQRPAYMELANRTSEDYEAMSFMPSTSSDTEIASYHHHQEQNPNHPEQREQQFEQHAMDLPEDEAATDEIEKDDNACGTC